MPFPILNKQLQQLQIKNKQLFAKSVKISQFYKHKLQKLKAYIIQHIEHTKMKDKSYSPLSIMRKLNTDRSQYHLQTARNSQSAMFEHSLQKNTSQILKTAQQSQMKAEYNRKTSVSSYYFRNCKKNNKNGDGQTFSKYLKNKNQQTKRKRCVTTVNLTTNKISLPGQKSLNTQNFSQTQLKGTKTAIQIEVHTNQRSKFAQCRNHPNKVGYFQQQNSFNCFCHQCSIDCVKSNKRLIQLTPEIVHIKGLISTKIQQAEEYAERLCERITQTIKESKLSLQNQYHTIKMNFIQQIQEDFSKRVAIGQITLKQIDWSFISRLSQNQPIKELQFLKANNTSYVMQSSQKMTELNKEGDTHIVAKNCTQTSTKFDGSTNKYDLTNQQVQLRKQRENAQPNKLMHEIERVLYSQKQKKLNYQSRKSCLGLRKTIDLSDSKFDFMLQNLNKQNISPNIMAKNRVNSNTTSNEMTRISFGSYN